MEWEDEWGYRIEPDPAAPQSSPTRRLLVAMLALACQDYHGRRPAVRVSSRQWWADYYRHYYGSARFVCQELGLNQARLHAAIATGTRLQFRHIGGTRTVPSEQRGYGGPRLAARAACAWAFVVRTDYLAPALSNRTRPGKAGLRCSPTAATSPASKTSTSPIAGDAVPVATAVRPSATGSSSSPSDAG